MYQSLSATNHAATLQDFKYLPPFASWLARTQLKQFTAHYLLHLRQQSGAYRDLSAFDSNSEETRLIKAIKKVLLLLAENKSGQALSLIHESAAAQTPSGMLDLLQQGCDTALHLLPQYHKDQSLSLAIVRETLTLCHDFSKKIIKESASQHDPAQDRLPERLRTSEQRYKEAELIAHIGHFSYDILRMKHEWTDELYRIFGWTPGSDENQVQFVNKAVLKEDLPGLKAAIADGIANCHSFKVAFRIKNYKGNIRHLQVRAQIRCDAVGAPVTIFGVVQDVTEHALLLQRLCHSKQLYKQAQAIAKVGNWRYDVLTGHTYWSSEASNLFGLPHSENHLADLQAIRKMTPFRFRLLIDGNINRCVRTGAAFSFESEAILSDGSRKVFFYKGIADKDASGQITGVVGTVQDITDRKIIEEMLTANQLFSKKIADATPAIIWLADKEKNAFSFVSCMAERILGYTSSELIEQGFSGLKDLMHPDDFGLVNQQMEQTFPAQQTAAGEDENAILETCYRIRHKNGNWIWLRNYSIVFERDSMNGNIRQMLHISVDVTSAREAENELSRKNQLLQQSNASLQEFAYIASHDLQEPLRKIATFGNMLQSLTEHPNPEKALLYTGKIVSSARRMQNMINDLLTVSLISGNTTFRTACLQSILEETLLMQGLKDSGENFRVDLPVPLPEARVVPAQIQQLFQNLLSNAVKFARKEVPPVVTITWERLRPEMNSRYGLDQEQAYLQINIADNGIGFDNVYAQRIFAMFQRLNGHSEYEGTGIGLAICRKIAVHHGGTIFASSEKDRGSVFSLVLPA